MRLVSAFFVGVAALLLGLASFFSAVRPAVASVGDRPDVSSYAPNQLIVKYSEGNAPDQLQQQVNSRFEKRRNFFGIFILFYQDMRLKLAGQQSPEVKLSRLQHADQQAGVISRKKLTESNEPTFKNIYLLQTDGRMEVMEMVSLYQNLPEVSFAEPNYVYSTMGAQ